MGWVVFVALVSACKQKCCFPCNSGVLWCNVCSKHVFQFCFGSCLYVCYWLLVLEVRLFSVCSFVERNTIDSLFVWILSVCVDLFVFLLFDICWFVFPIKKQTQKPWNSENPQKPKMQHKSRKLIVQLAQFSLQMVVLKFIGGWQEMPFVETLY